jgi:hypothetical protein
VTSYQVNLTLKSRNVKTGPIPVSTTTEKTCPSACPLIRGCYAKGGPLAGVWRKVTAETYGGSWESFTTAVAQLPEGQLWRHNQAGDLPGDRETIDAVAMGQLVEANRGRRGWTYTHYDVLANRKNLETVKAANQAGFVVNLSANNLDHADALAETGAGPVVTVLPGAVSGKADIRTPAGRRVVVCPATYRDDVSCASCKLCARSRAAIVGFPVHGAAKRLAEAETH